jgi:hypothetical protein
MKTADQSSTRMQANIVTLDAYAALEVKTKRLKDENHELKRKRTSDKANPKNTKINIKTRNERLRATAQHAQEMNQLRAWITDRISYSL